MIMGNHDVKRSFRLQMKWHDARTKHFGWATNREPHEAVSGPTIRILTQWLGQEDFAIAEIVVD